MRAFVVVTLHSVTVTVTILVTSHPSQPTSPPGDQALSVLPVEAESENNASEHGALRPADDLESSPASPLPYLGISVIPCSSPSC